MPNDPVRRPVRLDGEALSGDFRIDHLDYTLAQSLARRKTPEVVYNI